MNKKGQSLVMFIIFLPILLMACAFIIDVGLMYNAKIKGNSLLKNVKEERNESIKEYFKINNLNVKSIENTVKNDKSCVIINYNIESVFGSLMGFKEYEIEVTDC